MNKWETEPDYLDFEYLNAHCVVKRSPFFLSLLGYIGVKKEHPFYGKDYDEVGDFLQCHGGLTYSGYLEEGKEDLWYFGFDCAHSGDLVPKLEEEMALLSIPKDSFISFQKNTYRDIEYVTEDLKEMAKELHKNRLRIILNS